MNTEQNEEQLFEVESTHPGTVLRQAREAMGLSDQDVADRLRLRVSVIQDLEENCCDEEQITTFTRGYIRSYAKLVGVNADELLHTFKPAPEAEDNVQKMQSFSRKTRRDKHDSRVMGLTWVILAVAVGLTAFWWWQNQQNDPLLSLPEGSSLLASMTEETPAANNLSEGSESQQVQDVTESIAPLLADMEETNSPAEEAAVIETSPEVSENQDVEQQTASQESQEVAETAPAVDVPEQAEETVSTPVVTTPTLSMSFSGDCWVDIRDASGKRLLTGIKSAGETVELSGDAPFKLVLGAPAAVSLAFNGENVDLSGYPSGRVARLSLPK
ncbi:cytoskeleton protein RodZ [Grimontia kaedaensis]|uniref:Cytoskeleton protein RodZ n=1 Tax=Grimontia kaedaensis TaxID=2872157 RepID=A0ABY4WQV0_9GAMM|nr:cytoskeleton protein RodZ [Grimontia kaedaensis]USH01874.1 cytoskeleton protein RodZ [Grimontia kaedaensis]